MCFGGGCRLHTNSKGSSPGLYIESVGFDRLQDAMNLANIATAANHWGKSELAKAKTRTMTSYCRSSGGAKSVPDPYYGGPEVSCVCMFSLLPSHLLSLPLFTFIFFSNFVS